MYLRLALLCESTPTYGTRAFLAEPSEPRVEGAIRRLARWRAAGRKNLPLFLLRKVHAAEQIPKSGIVAKTVQPKVGFDEIGQVRGFLLVRSLQEFKCLILVAKTRPNYTHHIRRNIAGFGLQFQVFKNL